MNRYVCEAGGAPSYHRLNADIKSKLLISMKSSLLGVEA
jgi:hypothetical protein